MIKELILKEISKRIIDSIIKSIKNTKVKSYTKESDLFNALNQHLTFVNQWSSEVNFSDLKHAKSTNKVFVALDIYFQPQRIRISENEQLEKFELAKIFDFSKNHIALLGQVGSGKTTSLNIYANRYYITMAFSLVTFAIQ
jgi:predicted NACHT family NTPase